MRVYPLKAERRDFQSFQTPFSDNPQKPLVFKSDQNLKEFYSNSITQNHQTLAEIKQNLEKKTYQTKGIERCDGEVNKSLEPLIFLDKTTVKLTSNISIFLT